MDAHDERFFVVAAVKDADASALGEMFGAAPQEIVVQLFGGGRLERCDFTTLRIDARHHVLDRAVLAGGIHRLKNNQYGPAVLTPPHLPPPPRAAAPPRTAHPHPP